MDSRIKSASDGIIIDQMFTSLPGLTRQSTKSAVLIGKS